MGWFSVTTTIRSGNGANVSFAFRAKDIETLEDLADELAANACVVGERFRVINGRAGNPGILDDRKSILLARDGIASVVAFPTAAEFELRE